MKRLKHFKIFILAAAALLAALGVVLIAKPALSPTAVCWILGGVCAFLGLSELSQYFNLGLSEPFYRFDLATGLIGVLAGLLLMLHPSGAEAMLPTVAGMYVITGGVYSVQQALEIRRGESGYWWIPLVTGAATALLGFLVALNLFRNAEFSMLFLGVTLIVAGVDRLAASACASRFLKKKGA